MIKKITAQVPSFIPYILTVYSIGMGCFSFFRILLLISERDRINDLPNSTILYKAFGMGLRFDTVISGYLLALPLLVFTTAYFLKNESLYKQKFIIWTINILYSISFLISAVDIPYFSQFFMRLNISVFNWFENPMFVVKMITSEFKYSWTTFPFLLLVFFFCKTNLVFYKKFITTNTVFQINKTGITFFLILATLTFAGIRGRISIKSPIRVGTAYFSNHAFTNQLGLNPTFTFLRSCLNSLNPKNKKVHLMDDAKAITYVQNELKTNNSNEKIPIARKVYSKEKSKNLNVILVIMESMSAGKMGRYGNLKNLTPSLDSLASISTTFDNIYTAGIHTYNGIYSTLTSYPALFEQHSMKGVNIPSYECLPKVLKKNGYSTTYFTTHDEQFDNVAGFLSSNGIEKIYSQKDYPSEEVKSTLGVTDDYLFRYSESILDELAKQSKPFFVSMMTASDHGPYVIPEYFKPKSKKVRDQIVEYADWSIGQFIKQCSKKPWYKNTIFVFIADHGGSLDATYDMPLNYHHSPLIFHNPTIFKAKSRDDIGGQIDLFPTLMGYLNINYTNNTLGIDLNEHERPFIYFCADNKYGALNNKFYYINRKGSTQSLYKYKNKDRENYLESYPELVDSIKNYTEAMMQTAQFMISSKQTSID